jgi:Calcineurin-like phosphoesterase
VIAQNLNRDFVLGTASGTADEIDRLLANRRASVFGAPSPLDDLSDDELRQLADWLREAVAEVDAEREDVEPEQVSDRPPPPKDDYAFMPRAPELGLMQAALEEQVARDAALEVEIEPMHDDRRSGPEPVVTDRRLAGVELDFTGDGRRVWRPFEVAHPKLLSDPRWVLSLYEKVKALGRKATFVDDPPTIDLGERARVVLVGDWGSGLPRALRVRDGMARALAAAPDGYERHVVHLGDVYYSGTEGEYRDRFLDPWPTRDGDGTHSYALNGNHDMYSGGFAYFEHCLTDSRFAAQRGSSYFRLANERWQLLALDTSYTDKDLHGGQLRWVTEQLASFGGHSLLLSHHQLFSPYETTAPKVHEKLASVLREHGAAGWFWAHEHRCLVYRGHDLIPFASCVGHGGIPEYLVKQLPQSPAWLVYEYRKRHSTDWQPWNTFGFAVLDINDGTATVTYVDEDGDDHYDTEVLQP